MYWQYKQQPVGLDDRSVGKIADFLFEPGKIITYHGIYIYMQKNRVWVYEKNIRGSQHKWNCVLKFVAFPYRTIFIEKSDKLCNAATDSHKIIRLKKEILPVLKKLAIRNKMKLESLKKKYGHTNGLKGEKKELWIQVVFSLSDRSIWFRTGILRNELWSTHIALTLK